MEKEKIIQIAYEANDKNPTLLTSKGRVLKVCYNGKTHLEEYNMVGIPAKQTQTIYETSWFDITPKIDKL